MADQDPYRTPRASLAKDSHPFSFQPGETYTLQVSELRLAGWLAFISATLTIPYYWLWFEVAAADVGSLEEVATLAGLVMTAAALFVLTRFRQLLNQRSRFHGADVAIQWLIFLAIGMAVLSIMLAILPASGALEAVSFVVSVAYGVVLIRLGRCLRECPDSLYGRLPMMIQLMVVSGVLIATVLLALLSAFTSVVVDILFGLVFFDAARELKQARGSEEH